MSRAILLLAGVLLAVPAWAQQKVLYEKSELRFVSKQMNVPVEGRFKRWTADVNVDPSHPETGRATIEVDLASIDMNSPDGEAEAKDKLWFDVKNFPRARFTLSGVRALGADKYEAQGKLAIKGLTRDVAAPFTLRQDGAQSVAEGGFVLKRLEFKIGEGEWADTATVANEVQVRFRLTMAGTPVAK
jgi:polyisoprenoid-binding protein YceI